MTRAKLFAWATELRDRFVRAQTPARILAVSMEIDKRLDIVAACAKVKGALFGR